MTYRIARKDAVGMDELIREFISDMKLTGGLDAHRIYAAWDEVSGMARYTVRKFYRDGTLYCTMSSSVVRSSLLPKRKLLIDAINARLKEDELFSDSNDGVKNLILK